MIAHHFERNAPRSFILVSTPRFLGMRNSKKYKIKNIKAIHCTEIQDGRRTSIKNLFLLITFFKNSPRRFNLLSTHKFLGMNNSKKYIEYIEYIYRILISMSTPRLFGVRNYKIKIPET